MLNRAKLGQQLFELGAADFIRKPIQKEILLVRVKNVLAKSQRRNVEV